MWPFTSKTLLAESGLFDGFVECHCHLLPGVDDGLKTPTDTDDLISQMCQAGVSHIWLTPHIMEDIPNTTAYLKDVFAHYLEKYDKPILLGLAAEHMLDNLFEERINQNDVLPIADFLLVETSYFAPPARMNERLRMVSSKGYYPMLAHPERYQYMNWDDYKKLKDKNIFFQLNIPSLIGKYGPVAEKKSIRLLKNGYYDFFGTDTHSKSAYLSTLQAHLPNKIIKEIEKLKPNQDRLKQALETSWKEHN